MEKEAAPQGLNGKDLTGFKMAPGTMPPLGVRTLNVGPRKDVNDGMSVTD